MQTDALKLAKHSADIGQSERLSWDVMTLQVTDVARAADFWASALGLRVHTQDSQAAALGTSNKTLFFLEAGATVPVSSWHLGMYHVALGMPDQAEFSRLLARLITMRVPFSLVDHLMSKAIYLADPDGLEIEIALETPERFGRFGDMSKGLVLYTADGETHSGRAPLDAKAELSHARNADLKKPVSDEAFLAHLHLKVSDLDVATVWFERIGFARNLMLRDFGMADMGAGAAYTHRLAMNIWAGPNLAPAPNHMAKLTRYTLNAHDPDVMASVEGLTKHDRNWTGLDPSGIEINIVPAF
ncbi:MAG: VOC family protein [Roseibium sp.]